MKTDRISSRGAGWALLAIALVVAATFRLMWFSEVRHTPQYEMPVLDAGFHHVWAKAWSSGEWKDLYGQRVSSIPEEAFFRPPGYAAFLSVIYRFSGTGSAALYLQFLIGLLTILLTYLTGSKINPLAGGAGAVVYALYWPALCYESVLLDTVLSGFLLTCMTLTLSRWLQSDKIYYLIGAGFFLGLCALVRPNILLFAPVAALIVFVYGRKKGGWRNAFQSTALLSVITLMVVLPVTVRNWMVSHQPVLISNNGGINFYIGNGPYASGVFCSRVGELGVYNQTDDSGELAQGLSVKAGRQVSDQEVGKLLFKEACAHIARQPAQWFKLMGVKLGYYFGEPGVRLNIDAYGSREKSKVLRALPFSFAFLVAAGMTGLMIAVFRDRHTGVVLFSTVAVWTLSIVLFFVTDQYRQVIAPVLAAGSGMAVYYFAGYLREKRLNAGIAVLCGFVLLMFLADRNWNDYKPDRVFRMLNDASALSADGRVDDAERIYSEIVEMPLKWQLRGEREASAVELSSAAKAANALAVQSFRDKDWVNAEKRYSLSLSWNPDFEVMGNYGVCLLALNRLPEAVKVFEESLKGQPFAEHTRLYYAEALYKSGRREAALEELKKLAGSQSEFGERARKQIEQLQ